MAEVASGTAETTPEVSPVIQTPVVPIQPVETAPTAPGKTPGDEDDLAQFVDKDGNVSLPWKSLQSRINRASKAALKSVFGTDDREAIKQSKAEYEKLLAEREKAHREQMTALEREKSDREKAERRAVKAEKALEAQESAQVIAEANREVTKIAEKFFVDDYSDYATTRFRMHLKSLDDDEVEKLTQKDVETWFGEFASKHPAMSKKAKPKEVEKPAITNGVDAKNRSSAKSVSEDKTARPGQPNSMSKEEIRKKYGVRW